MGHFTADGPAVPMLSMARGSGFRFRVEPARQIVTGTWTRPGPVPPLIWPQCAGARHKITAPVRTYLMDRLLRKCAFMLASIL